MIFDYAAKQLAGLWLMAWNRPEWRQTLDRSIDGVFKSFWAFAFAAPLAFLGYFSIRRAAARIPDFPQNPLLEAPFIYTISVEMFGYVLDWAISLTALVYAARLLKADRRIGDVIVGFNWLQVFVAMAQAAPLTVMSLTGSGELAGLLFLPATILIIAMFWGFLRRSLDTNIGATIALIMMLTLIGVVINAALSAAALSLLHAFSS